MVASESDAGFGAPNEIQDCVGTGRTGACHVEGRLAFQQGMWPVQERRDGIPVSMVGVADRIDNAPHLIKPFADFPGEWFVGFTGAPERRLGNNGSNHTIGAKHGGEGRG